MSSCALRGLTPGGETGEQAAECSADETERLGDDEQLGHRHEAGVADGAGEDARNTHQQAVEQVALVGDARGDKAPGGSRCQQQDDQREVGR